MQIVLSDHNCRGHAKAIFHSLEHLDYKELLGMELRFFEDVGLVQEAPDETVWSLCQTQGYLLLTGNRTAKDKEESLEFLIHQQADPDILPVVTVGDLNRVLVDRDYCELCAERLAEIVLELGTYRGVTRLFLPG